jgi:hypothetical protein
MLINDHDGRIDDKVDGRARVKSRRAERWMCRVVNSVG